jgi:hypothetical protein
MKDTYYFSHDYNSRNDHKIKKLVSKHGYLGYGLFWAIIEDLYNNANALQTDYESIAFDLRTSENIIESIINDFDLFVIEADNFGSLSVQRRLEERDAKSLKARESAYKRWNKDKENANALQTDSECNAIKERKVNEIKEKENKNISFNFESALISYGFNTELVSDWLQVRKAKKGTNTETSFNNFVSQVEKSGVDKNEILKICISRDWKGFNTDWIKDMDIPKEKKPFISNNPYFALCDSQPKLSDRLNQQQYEF